MKIVSAIGPTILRLVALCTIALAWLSTISIRNSTAAWKRPGTPEVARRAASMPKNRKTMPRIDEKAIESQWMTWKFSGPVFPSMLDRWVR